MVIIKLIIVWRKLICLVKMKDVVFLLLLVINQMANHSFQNFANLKYQTGMISIIALIIVFTQVFVELNILAPIFLQLGILMVI